MRCDVQGILTKFREQLFSKDVSSVDQLQDYFAQMDKQAVGELGCKETEVCLNYFGLFPTLQELNALLRHFGDQKDSIDWKAFLHALKGQLNPRRQSMIQKVFCSISLNADTSVAIATAMDATDFRQHPRVLEGRVALEQVRQEFCEGLQRYAIESSNQISLQEFTAYYMTVSATIPYDDAFCQILEAVWQMNEVEPNAMSPQVTRYISILRSKLAEKSHGQDEPRHALHRALRRFDTEENGSLTPEEFIKAADVFGLQFSLEQATELFQFYPTDTDGKLKSDEFIAQLCS